MRQDAPFARRRSQLIEILNVAHTGNELFWQLGVGRVRSLTFLSILSLNFFLSYFQTASGFSFAAGLPPLMCSSRIVATSASVTLEYQVASG